MGNMIASLSSGAISVPAGNAVFGAWTSIWTPPVSLAGFYLQVVTSSVGNGFGVFNLGFGSGTPSIIPIQYGAFDGGYQGFIYIPLFCPAGIEIQMQLYEANGTTDGAIVSLIGVQAGSRESSRVIQCVGSTGTGWGVSIGSGWTQIGTSLGSRARHLSLVIGNTTSTALLNTISIGYGASATAVSPLIESINTASNWAYTTYTMDFDVEIPPGQGIWANGNGGTNSRCMMYLGY